MYYLRGSNELWKVPVPADAPKAPLEPALVVAGVEFGPDDNFSISADGKTLVVPRAFRSSNIWLFTRHGSSSRVTGRPLTTGTSINQSPAIAPDQRQIAFISKADAGLVTMPLAGGPRRRLSFLSDSSVRSPAWSPDGRQIAFGALDRGTPRVWLLEPGSGRSRVLGRTVLERRARDS